MLHFVVCDDNPNILDKFCNMLESIFIKDDIEAEISLKTVTATEVLDYVKNNKVEVLILDINLKSNITGCDIASEVRKMYKDVYIIFTTGHLEYALLAYKFKTFDYLPKPIVYEKLEDTILRLMEDIKSSTTKFIKLNNNKTIIDEKEINYIKKDGMKLVFCTNNHPYETYGSFSQIKSCLPDNFIRCHKSFMANLNNILSIDAIKNTIIFASNASCQIGAKYKNKILEVLKNE